MGLHVEIILQCLDTLNCPRQLELFCLEGKKMSSMISNTAREAASDLGVEFQKSVPGELPGGPVVPDSVLSQPWSQFNPLVGGTKIPQAVIKWPTKQQKKAKCTSHKSHGN